MKFIFILSVLNVICVYQNTAELITVGVAIGTAVLGGGSWYKWDTLKDNTYCRFKECCNADYVPYDLEKLQTSLSQKMFGQPLVNELYNILAAHKKTMLNPELKNRKPLVISLHGWSGVGKNYATTLMAQSIYKKGIESSYVKIFMGKKDLGCTDMEQKQKNLVLKVNEVVKQCGMALVIIDEVNEICPSILDAIKPMLDYHHEVDGVDYRGSIFVFISNIGGNEITNKLLSMYDEGYSRSEVDLYHFEPILRKAAFYQGGFEQSSTIAHNLIDHYIPFLPLEYRHVVKCALTEFRENGVLNPTEAMLEDALSVITYGPSEDRPIFANNGCKRFTRHIPYVIEKHKARNKSKSEL